MRANLAGWYAARLTGPSGTSLRRVVYCFPSELDTLIEVCGDPGTFIRESDMDGSRFEGPFESAAVATATLRSWPRR
jgi:hypothetical protein